MKKFITVLPALFIVVCGHSHAARLFIQGGLHFGGDKLVSATFVGGATESVEAGGLISGSIGLISDINETVELRTSLGIKLDAVFADNGDITFSRFPVEVMLFTKGDELRFGAGISYHLSPELEIDLPFSGNAIVAFDDAAGFVAQIEYRLGERGHLGLKATVIDYEISNSVSSATVDGNSIGVVIGARF